MQVTIDNSFACQQTLTGFATHSHMNLIIYVLKLIAHSAEDTNVESSTENMDVESSRGIARIFI